MAIKREELQQRLEEQTAIHVHVRDLQDYVAALEDSDGIRVIGDNKGYWTLHADASAKDLEAAEHSVNTLRQHANAELQCAAKREQWIVEVRSRQEMRKLAGQPRPHWDQTGLFA
jgi:hypothetical protein